MNINSTMKNRKHRTRPGQNDVETIYGAHAVMAALANPQRNVIELTASENAAARFEEELAALNAKPTIMATAEISRHLPRDAVHQGLVLKTNQLPDLDLDDVPQGGILVVLDQVTDPHNVGAILRSCAAFQVDAIVTTSRHSPVSNGTLAKTASGALEHVPLVRVANLARALDKLADRGFERIGLDSDGDQTIEDGEITGGVAIVLGAEGKGLRRLTREYCDRIVRLDVTGPIRSLNVSNAAAVTLYALSRNRKTQPQDA